ncbi:MAG: CPBP family intramembrane glutamic endopeptidase [Anaerolineae bacterium]
MVNEQVTPGRWSARLILAIGFVALGAAIIIVFSPWASAPMLGKINDYLAKIAVSALLLEAAFAAKRSVRFQRYWQVLFGLFTLTVTVSLEWIFGVHISGYLGVSGKTVTGIALAKLNECFVVVSIIIALTLFSGGSLGSLYIQKGNLKLGLFVGLIAFLVFAAGAIPVAGLLFKAGNLSLARVLPWIPWVLLFVLANAALEELMFRGLFLPKLVPLLGAPLSIFLIALVFTVLHKGAFYTSAEYVFLAVTFPLALAWGYLAHKTNSLLASILFHAGADIPVILGIFANLSAGG